MDGIGVMGRIGTPDVGVGWSGSWIWASRCLDVRSAGGFEFGSMDYWDAIIEILDAAERIKLPHHRLDVVTIARREFAKRGSCDHKFIDPIEDTLRDCLRKWSLEEKKEIWLSTETGAGSTAGFEAYDEGSIDMGLEGELMYHIIEELSQQTNRRISDFDDDADEF